MMLRWLPDVIGDGVELLQVAAGVIPFNGAYRTAFSATPTSIGGAASGAVIGARAVKNDSGAVRIFVGSAAKIEELGVSGSATPTNRSKTGGYSSGTNRWWFSQGIGANEVIATNYADAMQVSTGGAFANLSVNAPKAKIVVTQSEALLALNYNDGTAVPNGIKISDRGDSTVWTAAAGNDAAAVRLVESPGPIVAGATLHDIVVAWKRNSMYVGRFVGGDEKWQFNLLSPHIGCFGQEAWAATPAGIIFFGPAGVFLFDGSVPRALDDGVRQTILDDVSQSNSWGESIQISHDEYSSCVFVWIPDVSAYNFRCYAYNYKEGRWSQPYPMLGTAVYDFGAASVSDLQSIVRDLNVFDYASAAAVAGAGVGHYIIAGDKKMYNLSAWGVGEKTASTITTGRMNLALPANAESTMRRVFPIFTDGFIRSAGLPEDLTCTVQTYPVRNFVKNTGASVSATFDATYKRFDVFATGKQFDVTITGGDGEVFAVQDIQCDVIPAGSV